MKQLADEIEAIADVQGMTFVNNNKATQRDIAAVGYPARVDGSPVLDIAAERLDGLGVGAFNIGLPGYQVALGFSEGDDPAEAGRFADQVITRLEKYWSIERLSPGVGAKPKPSCK